MPVDPEKARQMGQAESLTLNLLGLTRKLNAGPGKSIVVATPLPQSQRDDVVRGTGFFIDLDADREQGEA